MSGFRKPGGFFFENSVNKFRLYLSVGNERTFVSDGKIYICSCWINLINPVCIQDNINSLYESSAGDELVVGGVEEEVLNKPIIGVEGEDQGVVAIEATHNIIPVCIMSYIIFACYVVD